MPPPINQQTGSKAALITWTVITSILFVVATVLAIFAHVDKNRLEVERTQLETRYRGFISDADLVGDVKTQLDAAKQSDDKYRDMQLVNVVLAQRDELAQLIGGQTTADAVAASVTAKQAAADAGAKDVANLTAAITTLASDVKAKQKQLEDVETARKTLMDQLAGVQATLQTHITAKDAEVTTAQSSASSTQADTSSYRSEKDKQVQEIQAKADEAAKLAQDDMNRMQAESQELQNKIKTQQNTITGLQIRLRDLRQPVDQIVKQADGRILRTSSDGVVYINLGSGDQVVPGMSFEVFDRLEGIPAIGEPTTEVDLPKGKASIEIIKVSPGSSECRIIRQSPGATVVENDLIVNIVYDKSTKYNFLVYGKFDLDRNGQPTPQDADVIRRLATAWGGNVVETVDVNTDFVVMGKVPTIPELTPEEADTPEGQFRLKQAQDELAAYDDVLAKAQALNIPILNQNRFLYFTGYYEQSGR